VVQARGTEPVAVESGEGSAFFSDWSADGQALLVGAHRDGGWNVYRLPLAGAMSEPLTPTGGLTAMESRDGSLLYFTRPDRPGIWRWDLTVAGSGQEPALVVPDLPHMDRHNWRVLDRDGGPGSLFWVERTAGGAFLLRQDLASGQTAFLTEMPDFAGAGLAVSPDGGVILYPRTGPAAGDLMLLEKFLPITP
jgi:hypothetical protein